MSEYCKHGTLEQLCGHPECDNERRVANDIAFNKRCRAEIDAIIQNLKTEMESARGSRERSHALAKLQEAVMWFGMDLKDIADKNPGVLANPYPTSKDPSIKTVEPTADGLKL
jgi:hypothetical protein